jgi:hypothetical protein
VLHTLRVQLVEVVQHLARRVRCHQPFCRRVFEVVKDDVDADQGAWPAEAVYEVDRHV